MTTTLPPVGALVRHTTTYHDGTVTTMEGRIHSHSTRGEDPDYFFIGAEQLTAYLAGHGFEVKLEVLEAPLPPEPTHPDAYAKVTGKGNVVELFHRRFGDGTWWSVSEYQEEPLTWDDLHYRGEVVVLLPDPAADAPELPWQDGDEDTVDRVRVSPGGKVFIEIIPGYHTADEAELRGAAILRAVREARQP